LKEEGKTLKELTTRNLVDLFKEGNIEQQLQDYIKGTMRILPSMDAAIRNHGASIKTLEIQIEQMSKNRTLMYETRQMMILFLSRLNGYYCEEKKGSYGPQFLEAYSEASHINNSIPRKEKDPGSFTLPCFMNNVCFNIALVDLGASISVMPLSTYLNSGLGELAHTKLTVELADRTGKYPKGIGYQSAFDP
ncbi:hypothetical protein Tco_0114228, partial [Tanacetum coccineum]